MAFWRRGGQLMGSRCRRKPTVPPAWKDQMSQQFNSASPGAGLCRGLSDHRYGPPGRRSLPLHLSARRQRRAVASRRRPGGGGAAARARRRAGARHLARPRARRRRRGASARGRLPRHPVPRAGPLRAGPVGPRDLHGRAACAPRDGCGGRAAQRPRTRRSSAVGAAQQRVGSAYRGNPPTPPGSRQR